MSATLFSANLFAEIKPVGAAPRYDFIIIGSGSAGSVLANKLSENPEHKVLLLEAGGPDTKEAIKVPVLWNTLLHTEMDWDYWTEAEKGLNLRRDLITRAKTLGGCSSHNAHIYIRGHKAIYDEWKRLGNIGWGYDDVLPYFKALENNENISDAFHGKGGPLNVKNLESPNIFVKAFVKAAVEAGVEENKDFNGEKQTGVGFYQITQKDGQRLSTATAFLHPVESRKNLEVVTYAYATKLKFEGKKCVGVEYIKFGEKKEAGTTKEVIVSGGSINSPHLLLLSGVGPAEQLKKNGIPIIADLPGVGENLQDHPLVFVAYSVKKPELTLGAQLTPEAFKQWEEKKTGPYTTNGVEGGMFHVVDEKSIAPDLQFHVSNGAATMYKTGIVIAPTMIMPKSRGKITLFNADPFKKPKIEYDYFEDEYDMKVLVEGIKLARKIADQPALKEHIDKELLPGAAVQTDDQIKNFIRQYDTNVYHPVGSCKMGIDPMAVVGPDLKVRGLEGLRVIDASIMPMITNGNTNAPSIMIGAKGADLILAEHKKK